MNGSKKIFLQINFTSGIGDFYTYFCEVYFLSKLLKEKNYTTCLIFNSKRKIDFINLFQEKYYNFFDEIIITESPQSCQSLGDYKIIFPGSTWASGLHCWEAFAPNDFNEDLHFAFINLSRMGYLNIEKYSDYPKLSDKIIENTLNIKKLYNLDDYVILHFRDWDDIADAYNNNLINNIKQPFEVRGYRFNGELEFTESALSKLTEILKIENKILLFSNNLEIKKVIKEMSDKIVLLDENLIKTCRRDYNDTVYWDFCINEFNLISYSKKIYLFSNYSWISNFISYGILNNINLDSVNPYNSNNKLVETFGTYFKNLL
jgi:hypothetical protein